jgi:uncharacterized membrane protein required for colicin V production
MADSGTRLISVLAAIVLCFPLGKAMRTRPLDSGVTSLVTPRFLDVVFFFVVDFFLVDFFFFVVGFFLGDLRLAAGDRLGRLVFPLAGADDV